MNNKILTRTAIGLAAAGGIGALIAAYVAKARPWHLRWGATDEELTETLPGDEVKPDATNQVTHAITIDAPPERVWQWLVQIGQNRGGFYSYSFLENMFGLRIHNADEIHQDWQGLTEGDFIPSAPPDWLGGKYVDKAGWFVVRIEPNHALVLRDEIEHGSWAFILKPLADNKTRLIARARGNKPETATGKAFFYGFFEPAHFIMERKMLMTLKDNAEGKTSNENCAFNFHLTETAEANETQSQKLAENIS